MFDFLSMSIQPLKSNTNVYHDLWTHTFQSQYGDELIVDINKSALKNTMYVYISAGQDILREGGEHRFISKYTNDQMQRRLFKGISL